MNSSPSRKNDRDSTWARSAPGRGGAAGAADAEAGRDAALAAGAGFPFGAGFATGRWGTALAVGLAFLVGGAGRWLDRAGLGRDDFAFCLGRVVKQALVSGPTNAPYLEVWPSNFSREVRDRPAHVPGVRNVLD